ncbi:MAG: transglycosylase SLT domain-containing protein [Dysgonamonadaceae bacterium]|jgi:membrane-bound lytic murein transglycosylase D|nr:transglycosylase SLT domain-containing protein [Dysgonamonadaceae bacterium]
MKHYILFIAIALSGICMQAQTDENQDELYTYDENPQYTNDNELFVPESWESNLDSLMNSWYVKNYTHKRENPGYMETSANNDSTYISRLSKLNNIVELPYNEMVRNCIDLYVERRRSSVEYVLGLENFYFPMIEQALDQYGLPDELKYLSIVESALNPTALSRAGASGLWQFMLPTAKQHGLEINSLVDERRDPLKATYAACEYFKNMYATFKDWTLVIASYNCGAGSVNKAIRRAGSNDFWKIYPYLPKETRSYVPLFVAVNYVMNYYAQHQLYPVKTDMPPSTDTIMVNQALHFGQISEVLGIEKEYLRALNPQYKQDIIPGNSKPRPLKLPSMKAYAFVELQDSIAGYKTDEFFGNRTYTGDYDNNTERIVHVVKRGESIITISNRYGVSVSNIRRWNNLRSKRLAVGKRLVLYVDNGGYSISKQRVAEKSNVNGSVKSKKFAAYKIQKGDTLASIAKKFNCTQSEIRALNDKLAIKEDHYIRIPLPR